MFEEKYWSKQVNDREIESPMKHATITKSDLKIDGSKFESNLVNALKVLLLEEPKITHYDTIVGDGDCGTTLANGANSILKALKENKDFNPIYLILLLHLLILQN